MANRYATKTGVWSDTTVWDGGTLPGPGDVVRPNTFTVTIDQNITVGSLANSAAAPAAAGGSFVVSSITGTRTLTCDISAAGSTGGLAVSATSGTLDIVGTLVRAGSTNLAINGACTVNLSGSVPGASGSAPCVTVNAAATFRVGGNVTAGTNSSGHGINVTVGGALIEVTGDVRGGLSTSAIGVNFTHTGTAGNLIIGGNVYADVGAGAQGANAGGTYNIDIAGEVRASNNTHGVNHTGNGLVRLGGPARGAANNTVAVYARRIVSAPSGSGVQWRIKDDAGSPADANDAILVPDGQDENPPDEADVREGVTYGVGLEGTMAVPTASNVLVGVPVDHTVGTATTSPTSVDPADVWDYLTASASVAGSMGARLRDAATVASTGEQIEAAL